MAAIAFDSASHAFPVWIKERKKNFFFSMHRSFGLIYRVWLQMLKSS